ncbi:double zinc ribbon and ankyrin repeat-containing protein 1 isoform X2 [Chiloscyllium punctatum]|uniref:double zinc ribbon and ankyrin repeat-containing protein 1 isoform X2 n=1 Tax=Chiloscyllium punctatum TaxID=137246 RepID=UPI003B637CA6
MTAGSVAVPHIIPLRIPLLGKFKNEIDTNTPIELKSDTPDVDIYYTVNGSRPQFLKKPSYGENSTIKYREPFTLQAGKGTIKAYAVSRDGRESGVVTKVFFVEYIQPNAMEILEDDDKNFIQDYAKELSRQETQEGLGPPTATFNTTPSKEIKHSWEETIEKIPDLKIDDDGLHKSFNGPRFLNSRFGMSTPGYELTSTPQSQRSQLVTSIDASPPKTLSSTQSMRIQRETDFLKCAYCLAPRPSDPFARFCHECGSPVPPVPGRRLPPAEGAQMGLCVECKTMVPLNTPTCIVCEALIAPQLMPQASIHLKDKTICRSCGTGNPANIQHCLTCETRLSESPKSHFNGDFPPPLPSHEGKMLACSKCGRINNTDARFCDWCGAKPGPPMSYLSCSKCGATNHPYARFCGSCGLYLEPPVRMDSRNSTLLGSGQSTVLAETADLHSSPIWQPLTIPLQRLGLESKKDQSTQTVGLFYPSCKMLEKKEMEVIMEQERQQKMTDRRPLLTAISPGRGYWRLQLDHICAHLRSYTQNNTEFRALLGEPQMGKIVSATVHEDGYELSLQVNFVLAGNKSILTGKAQKLSENNFLSSVTEGRDGCHSSLTSLASESHSDEACTSKKPKSSRRKRQVTTKEERLPLIDRQLLKEVGPTGLGRVSEVQELLDEGADPNCSNKDNRPALTVAVMNQHHEVVPVLVQKGADINQLSGPCNASIKKKNDKALTAYDIVVKNGNDQLTSLFAAKMGQGMLDKFSKTKHVSLDVF